MKTLSEILESFYYDGENYFLGEEKVGAYRHLKFLEIYQITEQFESLRNGRFIGFSPKEQKWYGWNSWSIGAFGVGTKITKYHSMYQPKNVDEDIQRRSELWGWKNARVENGCIAYEDEDGSTTYESLPIEFGRGEFVVETLEEAKQLAKEYRSL